MKKILVMILTLGLCVSMSGCSDDGTDEDGNPVEYGYFIELESKGNMAIVYDRETKVKYYIYDDYHSSASASTHSFGITPIYNANGTLQIYEGE